jgi:hypothetical protein
MAMTTEALQVTLAANGFYPRAFRWQGRALRVLSVDRISTSGTERRFRVRTAIGPFELGLLTDSCLWRVRRAPNWLDRMWARFLRMPRYPLPPWRRRAYHLAATPSLVPAAEMRRESHANRLAVVRR